MAPTKSNSKKSPVGETTLLLDKSEIKADTTKRGAVAAPAKVSPSTTSPLKYTEIKDIGPAVEKLRDSFHQTQKTHSIQYRLNQLRNVYFALKDHTDEICDALYKDFRRVPEETKGLEIAGGLNELLHTIASLYKWSKPDPIKDLPVSMTGTPAYIEKIPLGVVLIISPFNYPFLLSLSAVVGALAAGNAVVLKQSEMTPHFSQLFTDLLTKALDDDIFFAVNGGIAETTETLNQKFDKIMYTGNNMVGTIVAKKAAETLTPVILELGGKSPAFVLEDVKENDLHTIASRIAWGRFTNCGQTCVAVDYVLVHESKHKSLLRELKKVVETEFYPGINKDDPNYTHLIHDRAYQNLVKRLDASKGEVVIGGERDALTRYIAPTVIDNVSWDDLTMEVELFGPLLPIIPYTDLKEAVTSLVKRHDTPLAQYVFTSNASRANNPQIDYILKAVRSGGLIINDVLLHVGLANAPFGGIGQSGHGAYHGEYSFRNFSHERTTLEIALWKESTLTARYPPFNENKANLVGTSLTFYGGKTWFGRTGDVRLTGPNPVWSLYSGIVGVFALGYYLYAAL